jgi:4-aminobutyrate aminotransferase-like enzyme
MSANNQPTSNTQPLDLKTGYSPEELKILDNKHILRAWKLVGEPVIVERGKGPCVWDIFGKKYIDCNSGLFSNNAGFSNQKIIDAINDQAPKLIQISMRQLNLQKSLLVRSIKFIIRQAELNP